VSSPVIRASCPPAVLVVGDMLSQAALESLRRTGLAVTLLPRDADVPLSFTPRCIVVCSRNGNGPDLCKAARSRPDMQGIPLLLALPSGDLHPSAVDDRALGQDLGARVLSLVRDAERHQGPAAALTDADQFRMLAEAGRDLLSCLRPAEYVQELFGRICRRLCVDLYVNYLVDDDAGCLRLNSYGGLSPETARRIEWLAIGEAICGTVAREQKSMTVECVQQSTDPRTELIRSLGIQAYACFPLIGEQGFRGTVSFGSRSRPSFLASELDLMAGVADLAAVALERSALLRELEAKAKALEASNRDLEEFAFAVSHDLREPLRSISAFTDLLARRSALTLDSEASQLLGFVKAGTQRMGDVIDAVLRFSCAKSGPPDAAEIVDLGSVAAEAVSNLTAAIRSVEAEIVLDALPEVRGDRTLLLQLLQNLIENAVKYRGPDKPRIRVGCASQNGGTALFVRDNGIGIDASAHETIFGIFKRLHSCEKYAGAGIGLAVAKKIVERHGGRIWVESAPGQGATFWFTLPVQRIRATS
jgi:signal transduction histidine kinase